MRKCVVAGLILLGMALFVTTGISGGGKKIKGQLPPGWKNLDLSKEQILKIYTIPTQFREKVKALEAQIKDLRVQEKSDMVKVLSAEQKEQLKKILLGEDKKSTTKSKDKD
ncbi:MAG: hypothetical protein FJ271_13955 [Planctomycetes bacterium]|nr:hypothetical protein [Planctomycetota bacterium]